jgi:hypothetical protein
MVMVVVVVVVSLPTQQILPIGQEVPLSQCTKQPLGYLRLDGFSAVAKLARKGKKVTR